MSETYLSAHLIHHHDEHEQYNNIVQTCLSLSIYIPHESEIFPLYNVPKVPMSNSEIIFEW